MKLIIAIINRDDSKAVTQSLTKQGFSSTRLSTTGGFLLSSNVTVLVGVDEEAVNAHILEESKKLWGELNHCQY